MATATTSIGANSVAINYSVGATIAELLDAIQAFITTKGWDLFDAAAGPNARCYRALNADGTSYKYMVIDGNTANQLFTKVYESWNATTHVGTNLAFNSDVAQYSQRVSLATSGYIYVFANVRWCALLSKISDGSIGSSTGSSFCGCFEISKDNADEVAGQNPIYAWANGYGITGGMSDGTYPRCFSLPKTKSAATGDSASRTMTVVTLAGRTIISTSPLKLTDQLPNITNPWSATNNNFVFTMFAVESKESQFNVRGRFYGLKLLSNNLGTPFDLITVKTDADGFYAPTGSDQDHHILTNTYQNRFALPV
jgi:hypothetical protein